MFEHKEAANHGFSLHQQYDRRHKFAVWQLLCLHFDEGLIGQNSADPL
jgi:hypothetical protein